MERHPGLPEDATPASLGRANVASSGPIPWDTARDATKMNFIALRVIQEAMQNTERPPYINFSDRAWSVQSDAEMHSSGIEKNILACQMATCAVDVLAGAKPNYEFLLRAIGWVNADNNTRHVAMAIEALQPGSH